MRFKMPGFRDVAMWHRWFAWYPVQVGPDNEFAFLEYVLRRSQDTMAGAYWVYSKDQGEAVEEVR